MNCPRCGTPMQGGICPECGFPVNRLRMEKKKTEIEKNFNKLLKNYQRYSECWE